MKKGQVSIEFIVIIAIVLVLAVVFANGVFESTTHTKTITNIKLRTLDLINAKDSNATLQRIDFTIVDSNLNFKLFITDFQTLNLTSQDYNQTIENILKTTKFENVNLDFQNIGD